MKVIKSAKITAVDVQRGTITVKWNNDPDTEWNYWIPMDPDTGAPLEGEHMLRSLVATGYRDVKNVIDRRADQANRAKANFSKHKELMHNTFDLRKIASEYEEMHNLGLGEL